MQVLVNGGIYYLVNEHKPYDFAGMQPIKAVIAASPKLHTYKNFMKQEDGVYDMPWYMPPLEQEEVLEMLPIFPHVPKELVSPGPPSKYDPGCMKCNVFGFLFSALLLVCRHWHALMCMVALHGQYLTAHLMTGTSR